MADTEGVETSMTLSAMSASLLMAMVQSVEARTILTLAGSHWRNNSRKKGAASVDVLSLSPRSCCIRRKSCVGFRSPSSLPPISCCNFRCSKAVVCLTSAYFERIVGGLCREVEDQVSNFHGKLRTERADNIVKACLLRCNTSGCELCFNLSKPYFWISLPEEWEFDADSRYSGGG